MTKIKWIIKRNKGGKARKVQEDTTPVLVNEKQQPEDGAVCDKIVDEDDKPL